MRVFNSPYSDTSEVWSIQGASILFDDGDAAEILGAVDNITISYGRSVDTRFPLSSGKPIKLMGPPQGTIQLNTILGPKTAIEKFLSKFGSTCKPFSITIKTNSRKAQEEGCEEYPGSEVRCTGCIGTSLSYSLSAQQGLTMASGQFSLVFDNMDWASA